MRRRPIWLQRRYRCRTIRSSMANRSRSTSTRTLQSAPFVFCHIRPTSTGLDAATSPSAASASSRSSEPTPIYPNTIPTAKPETRMKDLPPRTRQRCSPRSHRRVPTVSSPSLASHMTPLPSGEAWFSPCRPLTSPRLRPCLPRALSTPLSRRHRLNTWDGDERIVCRRPRPTSSPRTASDRTGRRSWPLRAPIRLVAQQQQRPCTRQPSSWVVTIRGQCCGLRDLDGETPVALAQTRQDSNKAEVL